MLLKFKCGEMGGCDRQAHVRGANESRPETETEDHHSTSNIGDDSEMFGWSVSRQVRAWEVKAMQLALLTPRTPMEVGSGVCRLRETDEMKKKRLAYRSDKLRKCTLSII